jgi:predicted ATPase
LRAPRGNVVIGREDELAAVGAFLADRVLKPAALVLTGVPGIGKTTIVRTALGRAEAAGLRVFFAQPAEGLRAVACLLELLRLETAAGDLLVVTDDVQWLDRQTASALTFALRRLGPSPARAIVATRTDNASSAEWPLGLGSWDARRLEIGPLSTTELGGMLRQRLGKALPRPRVEALRRESGGNPMFALELAKAGSKGTRRTSTLTRAIEERVRRVDPPARTALSFAAAALRPHPLLASTAYELLLPAERREIHARLAAA